MDLFLFPSYHESFGNAALEAEAVGIPTICSARVPQNENIIDNLSYLPLGNQYLWARKALEYMERSPTGKAYNALKGSNLDIEVTAKWLQAFYLRIAKKGIVR